MAKRKQKEPRGARANACCPPIRVKCKFPKGAEREMLTTSSSSGFKDRAAAFLAAKAKLRKKYGLSGLGNTSVFRAGWERIFGGKSAQPSATASVAQPAQAKAVVKDLRKPGMCTISMGGQSWKMNSIKTGEKIAKLVKAQRKKRCIPSIKRR